MCLQNGLTETAFVYLAKSVRKRFSFLKVKMDLAFYELKKSVQDQVQKWRGRILLHNIMAYFFYIQKDFGNALRCTFEAQS